MWISEILPTTRSTKSKRRVRLTRQQKIDLAREERKKKNKRK